jgi:hypothetical protein
MKVNAPQLPIELDSATDIVRKIHSDEPFLECYIADEDLFEINAKGMRFSEVKAERVIFGGAKLDKSDFMDVLSIACDLQLQIVRNHRGAEYILKTAAVVAYFYRIAG